MSLGSHSQLADQCVCQSWFNSGNKTEHKLVGLPGQAHVLRLRQYLPSSGRTRAQAQADMKYGLGQTQAVHEVRAQASA